MSESQCPVCGQSFDGDRDHSLCQIAAFTAILDTIVNRNLHASLREAIDEAGRDGQFQSHFESHVGIPIGSTDGRWIGIIQVTFWRGNDIRRQVYATAETYATPEEAAKECDDMYKEYLAYCSLGHANVTIVDDPTDGRNLN